MAKVLRHRLFDMKLRDPQLFEPIAQTNEAETGPSFRDRKSLDTLPNEILLHIFGFITDPDDILKSDIMGRQNVNTLCDLALTCRRFKPIAQEVMVNTIAMKADDIGCKECNGLCTQTRLIILIKFLLAYPWLQEKVRALRIEVGQKREFPRYVPFFDNFMWNCAYLALNTNLADPYNNEQWVVALDDGYEPAFVGILLCLMPRLEQLILLPKSSDGARKTSPTMLELFGLDHETDSQSGRSWTSFRTPGLENLTHATFRSDWLPRGLNALNGLTSVDLFIGSGHAFEISEEYLYITSLRLNIAFEWIRAPHQPGCSTDYDDTFRKIGRAHV